MSDDQPSRPPLAGSNAPSPPRLRGRVVLSTYASTILVTMVTIAVVLAGSPGMLQFTTLQTPIASPVPVPTIAPTPTGVALPTQTAPLEPTATLAPTEVPAGTYPVSDEQVPILMYHYIRPDPGPERPIGQGLSVSPELFAEHLAFLADGGYTPISMADLADIWEGRAPLPPKPVVLTFDDGYRDFYTNAWPLLQQYSFPATVYVITSLIDQPNYLTRDMVLELDASGLVDFGSHTINHPSLPALEDADAEREIVESKMVLEDLLGHTVRTFCYPTGAYSDREIGLVDTAGYELAVTTEWDYADPTMNPGVLPRIRISNWTTAYELEMWL